MKNIWHGIIQFYQSCTTMKIAVGRDLSTMSDQSASDSIFGSPFVSAHGLNADMVDNRWPITLLGHWPWLSIFWAGACESMGIQLVPWINHGPKKSKCLMECVKRRNFMIPLLNACASASASEVNLIDGDEVANSRPQQKHSMALQGRHNEPSGVSNHRRLDCLLNRLFRCS